MKCIMCAVIEFIMRSIMVSIMEFIMRSVIVWWRTSVL